MKSKEYESGYMAGCQDIVSILLNFLEHKNPKEYLDFLAELKEKAAKIAFTESNPI